MYKKVCLLLFVLASICLPQQGLSQVIVSISPQKQFVNKIAGHHMSVEVILTPGGSPETYSPSPRQLATLSNAKVYIQMGVTFERHWTESLLAVNPNMKIMKCCQQFADIFKNYSQDDMHYWTDPVFVQHYLEQIGDTLIELQPDKKDLFKSNLMLYQNAVRELDSFITNRLKNRQHNQFIISHSALDAYSDRYGLVQLSLEQSGRESGPRKLLNIIDTAKRLDIRTLFVVEQYHTRTVDNLAQQLGAKVRKVDPLADDYLGNMYEMTNVIAKALVNKK